jgi:hypothetical protein
MVSYFDHATGQVPRPRVVLVKKTDDAHENPTLQIDDSGHLWAFCNSHGPANNSYIFRSVAPYSIDEFEQIVRTNFRTVSRGSCRVRIFVSPHAVHEWEAALESDDEPDERVSSCSTAVTPGYYQISNRRGDL